MLPAKTKARGRVGEQNAKHRPPALSRVYAERRLEARAELPAAAPREGMRRGLMKNQHEDADGLRFYHCRHSAEWLLRQFSLLHNAIPRFFL